MARAGVKNEPVATQTLPTALTVAAVESIASEERAPVFNKHSDKRVLESLRIHSGFLVSDKENQKRGKGTDLKGTGRFYADYALIILLQFIGYHLFIFSGRLLKSKRLYQLLMVRQWFQTLILASSKIHSAD